MIESPIPDSLAPRPAATLAFIREYIRSAGFPPSVREIMLGTRARSSSAASYRIEELVRLGYLTKVPDISRGLRLTQKGCEAALIEKLEEFIQAAEDVKLEVEAYEFANPGLYRVASLTDLTIAIEDAAAALAQARGENTDA